jgi:hypothetical protein
MINSEYEYIALHRDVGETELKQGREIRKGGTLGYVDSAAVRAVKHGRILILEGIERAERGIMPVGTLISDSKTRLANKNPAIEQFIREQRDVRVRLPPLTSHLIWLVTGISMTEHI